MSRNKNNTSRQQITQRAYELWHTQGCPAGDGVEDWLEAESELLGEARQRKRGIFKNFFGRWDRRLARVAAMLVCLAVGLNGFALWSGYQQQRQL